MDGKLTYEARFEVNVCNFEKWQVWYWILMRDYDTLLGMCENVVVEGGSRLSVVQI